MLHLIFFAEEEVEKTVCIVQSTCINVHTMTGKDFIPPLPFPVRGGNAVESEMVWIRTTKHLNLNLHASLCFMQVSKVWVTKFGLLLERKNTATETQFCPPGYTLTIHISKCEVVQLHTCIQTIDSLLSCFFSSEGNLCPQFSACCILWMRLLQLCVNQEVTHMQIWLLYVWIKCLII